MSLNSEAYWNISSMFATSIKYLVTFMYIYIFLDLSQTGRR